MQSTDQGLNHVGPVVPHCIDKLKHIEVLLPLHPLQHGVQTDVRARATYASTVREEQGCEGEGGWGRSFVDQLTITCGVILEITQVEYILVGCIAQQ